MRTAARHSAVWPSTGPPTNTACGRVASGAQRRQHVAHRHLARPVQHDAERAPVAVLDDVDDRAPEVRIGEPRRGHQETSGSHPGVERGASPGAVVHHAGHRRIRGLRVAFGGCRPRSRRRHPQRWRRPRNNWVCSACCGCAVTGACSGCDSPPNGATACSRRRSAGRCCSTPSGRPTRSPSPSGLAVLLMPYSVIGPVRRHPAGPVGPPPGAHHRQRRARGADRGGGGGRRRGRRRARPLPRRAGRDGLQPVRAGRAVGGAAARRRREAAPRGGQHPRRDGGRGVLGARRGDRDRPADARRRRATRARRSPRRSPRVGPLAAAVVAVGFRRRSLGPDARNGPDAHDRRGAARVRRRGARGGRQPRRSRPRSRASPPTASRSASARCSRCCSTATRSPTSARCARACRASGRRWPWPRPGCCAPRSSRRGSCTGFGRPWTIRVALTVACVTQLLLGVFLSLPIVLVAAFVIGLARAGGEAVRRRRRAGRGPRRRARADLRPLRRGVQRRLRGGGGARRVRRAAQRLGPVALRERERAVPAGPAACTTPSSGRHHARRRSPRPTVAAPPPPPPG